MYKSMANFLNFCSLFIQAYFIHFFVHIVIQPLPIYVYLHKITTKQPLNGNVIIHLSNYILF